MLDLWYVDLRLTCWLRVAFASGSEWLYSILILMWVLLIAYFGCLSFADLWF